MARDCWSPGQYEVFKAERERPFHDLLALVRPVPGGRVVDLGCGSGDLTRVLHRTLQATTTIGVDASPAMLAKAAAFVEPGLSFREGTIEAFTESAWDVVFSNAAVQWCDDHRTLLPRLAGLLKPGGQLAIQMPANHDHPSHLEAAALAREEPFASALGGYVRVSPVLDAVEDADLLREAGLAQLVIRTEVYVHELASADGVVEWVKGTLLTDYERRLPAAMWPSFLERYRDRMRRVLPDRRPFPYYFKRILLAGTR